jgi:hypothetical protein
MKTLSHEKRCAVIRCLCDGVSIAATTRITGVAKNSIQKLSRHACVDVVLTYDDARTDLGGDVAKLIAEG